MVFWPLTSTAWVADSSTDTWARAGRQQTARTVARQSDRISKSYPFSANKRTVALFYGRNRRFATCFCGITRDRGGKEAARLFGQFCSAANAVTSGLRDKIGLEMKRRRLLQVLAASPAAPALLRGQQGPTNPALPATNPAVPLAPNVRTPGPAAGESAPALTMSIPDDVADTETKFFSAPELAALTKLADILQPASKGAPGALQAGVPAFLDFLLSESPKERQTLYRTGLDQLNAQARAKFGKAYADLDKQQAETLLAPLRQPWTYEGPADPVARFLQAAKVDVRTATENSKEYVTTVASSGRRRFGGSGLYWYPLD